MNAADYLNLDVARESTCKQNMLLLDGCFSPQMPCMTVVEGRRRHRPIFTHETDVGLVGRDDSCDADLLISR